MVLLLCDFYVEQCYIKTFDDSLVNKLFSRPQRDKKLMQFLLEYIYRYNSSSRSQIVRFSWQHIHLCLCHKNDDAGLMYLCRCRHESNVGILLIVNNNNFV